MRSLYLALFFLLNIFKFTFCQDTKTGDEFINLNYLSTYNAKGLPDNVQKDEIDLAFMADIDKSLPEDMPVLYIDPSIVTSIILQQQAEVYISFMYKSSYHKNSLGFYLYNVDNPPKSPTDINFHTIVFPNIANSSEGGDIFSGYKVKLGKFKANTAIGWFLISDGWSTNRVVNGRQIYYSHSNFNPETQSNQKSHTILLNDPDRQKFILGFEDDRRDGNSNNDFNDVVCYLDVFPYTAVQTTKLALLSTIRSNGNNVSDENMVVETIMLEPTTIATTETTQPDSTPEVTIRAEPVLETITTTTEVTPIILEEKSPCNDIGISYKHFSNIKATVTAQPSISSKKTIMKRMLVGHIISTKQAGELISLLDEDEGEQLDMAGLLFENVCDKESYSKLSSFFTGSALKKFEAFIESSKDYVSNNETSSTISTNVDPPKLTMDVNANESCDKPIMNEKQMKRFINSIRSRSFASEKFMVVEQAVGYNCFTVSQVIEIVTLFVSEKDRFELAKHLFDYTIDNQHYNRLTGAFGLESSINEFKDFLKSKQ